MILNPAKFQTIVLQKGNKNNNTNITLNIENITVNTSKSVKLSGTTSITTFEEQLGDDLKQGTLFRMIVWFS